MNHWITTTPDGATCACGRTFSVWTTTRHSGWSAAHDARRGINLARGNARRHADAANRKASQ